MVQELKMGHFSASLRGIVGLKCLRVGTRNTLNVGSVRIFQSTETMKLMWELCDLSHNLSKQSIQAAASTSLVQSSDLDLMLY